MYVYTYQLQNINRRKGQLFMEGAFEITENLGIRHVRKNVL